LGEIKYEGEHEPKAEINILRGSFDLDAARRYFRRRELQTRYVNDYGYSHTHKKQSLVQPPRIFLYKKISEMEFKLFLTNDAKDYLDKWLLLNDYNLQEAVLECLRSLNSRFKINQTGETEYRGLYNERRKDWNLTKPTDVSIFVLNKSRMFAKRNVSKSMAVRSISDLRNTCPDERLGNTQPCVGIDEENLHEQMID